MVGESNKYIPQNSQNERFNTKTIIGAGAVPFATAFYIIINEKHTINEKTKSL